MSMQASHREAQYLEECLTGQPDLDVIVQYSGMKVQLSFHCTN